MTDTWVTVVTSAIAAMPPTLMALAALRQGQRNGDDAGRLIQRTDEIHTLTNSTLSELTRKYDVSIQKIEGLESLIAELSQKGKKDK